MAGFWTKQVRNESAKGIEAYRRIVEGPCQRHVHARCYFEGASGNFKVWRGRMIQHAVRTGRIDLRKVAGEQNPADLLTKHSIGRQRLESLIALYGCKYLEGRAATAPLTRTGESSRPTMAQADEVQT